MTKKTVKKAVSAKKKTAKKPAKKVAKKVAQKSTKKVAKKPVKKVAKKPAKKVTKKVAKKVSAKTAPKEVLKKVAKKVTKKATTKSKSTKKKNEVVQAVVLESANKIAGKNFLFTGTLSTMQRKDAEKRVKDLGGNVVSGVNAKLDYLVVGEKAGSKLKAAQKIPSIKIIDEAQFNSMSNGEGGGQTNTSTDVYRIEFHVYGYGKENCVTEMTEAQMKYWKAKFKDKDSDAQSELSDHLWNYDYDEDIPDTHFGKWYDQDDEIHDEKAYYSDSTMLNVTVYKNGDYVEEISKNVTHKSLEKSFYNEFVPNKKDEKGKAFLYSGAVDRGAYCEGSFELEPGEVFDEKKLSIIVGKIFNSQFVWDICYGDYGILDDEGCQSSTGKGFEVDVYFF